MKTKNSDKMKFSEHVDDADLISYLDGELGCASPESIRSHLEDCWECASRRSDFQSNIENFLEIRQENLLPKVLPPSGPALELFRERLAAHRTLVEHRSYLWFKIPKFRDVLRNFSTTLGFINYEIQTPQPWKWQIAGATFIILAIFLVGLISVVVYKKHDFSQSSERVAVPETRPQITVTENLQQPQTLEVPNQQNDKIKVRNRKAEQRATFKKVSTKLWKNAKRTVFPEKFPRPEIKPEGEFHAIAFVGGLEETPGELNIIPSELSRAELIALGINPPKGKKSDKIKTDLLVGADGLTRGIRLLK